MRSKPEPLPITETENLASATECTGLAPAAVQSPQEGEDYARLYAIHQPKPVREKEKRDPSRPGKKE